MADASSSSTPPAATRPAAPNHNRVLIDDASVRLVQLGVNPSFFEEKTFLSMGYTEAIYAGLLRPFSDARDTNRCEQLLQLGVTHKYFSTDLSMPMSQFTDFLHFLRSPAGQGALARMAQRDRLAKRGGDFLSAQEIGHISMLEAQISDMANEINDCRRHEDEEVARHEAALREIRARTLTNIEEIKQSYQPAGFYKSLTTPELNRACWNAYRNATARQKKVPVPVSEKSLTEAVRTYSDVVRQRHMLVFLKTEGYEQALNEYIVEKIGRFDEAREERAAKRFRGLLEIVGADVPAALPASSKGRAAEGHPSGDDIRDVEEELFDTVVTE